MVDLKIKQDLVNAYHILAMLGLDDLTYTHLSARASNSNEYYIYPFGLLFSEVEVETLLKVNLNGELLEGKEFQYNRTGYIIHGNIYKARSDINFIFHLHTPEMVAVSAYKQGLLPVSQWALHFYNKISYHNYDSLALDNNQGQRLVDDLGVNNFCALLRNHGSIMSGKTVAEAMFYTHHLQLACKTQTMLQGDLNDYIMPAPQTCAKTVKDLLSFEKDLGQRDWLALLRKLYRYKQFLR